MKKLPLIIVSLMLFASCATKKQILYFQDAEELNNLLSENIFEPEIEANDILHVMVSSLDENVVAPFKMNSQEGVSNNQNPLLRGYLVNNNGNIQFPVLGAIHVAGKTRGEVILLLTSKLSEYVTDVVVDVRIINFKVTVIGGVNNPGVYRIDDERVTLPQAIGLAGDLSLDGKRNNIMIIRHEDGKQKVTRVDFTKTDFFESPYYFLKQNDVVYVEPSLKGVKKSGFIPDIPALLSLVTIILSTTIILTR
ncbi:polysaccharide biosynthesis/export family protein [Aureisphaera sp. CAU 1614]|uniref:Polysaccharide biosynthesis/export family protein n=1 Tax=Halomarinibacterium sedimenti TaxID=2857106 RepID=A0A9X1JV79_9FLAO|nr:polysaccharide biosynthesis/export family protein [Halomarinibacterium sedimenti]MBW2937430.1 polysaccharide biosynthesis/export family protein [Halomarinibacterium sedimenti]